MASWGWSICWGPGLCAYIRHEGKSADIRRGRTLIEVQRRRNYSWPGTSCRRWIASTRIEKKAAHQERESYMTTLFGLRICATMTRNYYQIRGENGLQAMKAISLLACLWSFKRTDSATGIVLKTRQLFFSAMLAVSCAYKLLRAAAAQSHCCACAWVEPLCRSRLTLSTRRRRRQCTHAWCFNLGRDSLFSHCVCVEAERSLSKRMAIVTIRFERVRSASMSARRMNKMQTCRVGPSFHIRIIIIIYYYPVPDILVAHT